MNVVFNAPAGPGQFVITTSAGNNTAPNQQFVTCTGHSIYEDIADDFSAQDAPDGFAPYPAAGHNNGATMTAEQFVNLY